MPSTQIRKAVQTSGLLQKLQSSPQLPAFIEKLEPAVLHKLIRQIGLEDSGAIIALATTAQLREVLDVELWKNRKPGAAERLDSDQFLSWLAVWNEIGPSFTATKLFELGDDFLLLCLWNLIKVADRRVIGLSNAKLDFDNLGVTNTDLDPWEAIQPNTDPADASQDYGDFAVLGTDIGQWDTVQFALNSLWDEQPDFLQRVLDRSCFERSILSEDLSEYDLKKVHHRDMAHARESKQEKQGFVTPLNASIFLIHAKSSELGELCTQRKYDLNTHRHFNLAGEVHPVENSELLRHDPDEEANAGGEEPGDFRELEAVLADADIIGDSNTQLLLEAPAKEESPNSRSALQTALNNLSERNPEALTDRLNEIVYMSNILMTGAELRGGRFLESEAAKAVMANCSLGLEYLVSTSQGDDSVGDPYWEHLLTEPGLVQAFQVGFNLVNRVPLRSVTKTTAALTSVDAENALHGSPSIRSDLDRALADGGLITKVEDGMFAEAKEIVDLLYIVFDHSVCHCLTSLVDSFPCFPGSLDHPDGKPLTVDTSLRYIRSLDDLAVIDHFLDNLTLSL